MPIVISPAIEVEPTPLHPLDENHNRAFEVIVQARGVAVPATQLWIAFVRGSEQGFYIGDGKLYLRINHYQYDAGCCDV